MSDAPTHDGDVDRQWHEWARGQLLEPHTAEAAEAALRLLRHGATTPAAMAAARIAARRGTLADLKQLEGERTWIQSVIEDLGRAGAPVDLIARYSARRAEVEAALSPDWRRPATAPTAATAPALAAALPGVAEAGGAPPAPPAPPAAPFSLRDLFAENSVLVLASLGAFLLVVATVLFELYGSVGLGGEARVGAVAALNLIFAVAGYLARRRPGLQSVGHIYIALAAVLLPLVGVAAWTFLELGHRGVTVPQAVAITSSACMVVYGVLARRLDLRPYGELAGVAVLLALFSASDWIGGDYWTAAGVAAGPLVYAAWEWIFRSRVFADFRWFGHASALVALGAAVRYQPDGWLWTVTLAVLALSYLAAQALAVRRERAWAGEAAAILAAGAASGPLGVGGGHFVLPFLVAVPLIVLSRQPELLGRYGEMYRPHVAHLHLAVVCGLGLATWAYALGEERSLAVGLWIAFALYSADFYAEASALTGYTLRAALVLALAATGRALDLGAWTAAVAALGLLAYAVPYVRESMAPLRRHDSLFFYGALVVVVANLAGAVVATGHWQIAAALAISAVGFGAAAEFGAVRYSPLAARGLFSLAWFAGVDAAGAQGWRGPFDAVLALVYVMAAQVRSLARHQVASASRRWFVHGGAAISLALCFTGSPDELWWRLAAALAVIAVAYWWLVLTRDEPELPWLAWSSAAGGAASVAMAVIPDRWQGAAVAGVAVALTGGWYAVRQVLSRKRLPTAGFIVLTVLAAAGIDLAMREALPTWPQATAFLLAAGLLAAWSLLASEAPLPEWRPYQRAAASFLGVIATLIACGVLQLNSGLFGLVAIALAAAHAEWSVRGRTEVERWYAAVITVAAAPALYLWPYAHEPAALVAVELVVIAALVAATAVRSGRWYGAYPAVLALVPALRVAFVAAGVTDDRVIENGFAVLAWVAGFAGLGLRTRFPNRWAWSVEAAAASIAAVTLTAMAGNNDPDAAGIALLAFAPLVYTSAMQDRLRWAIPFAPAAAFIGAAILLASRSADTILYAAALGVVGLATWVLGRAAFAFLGRHPVVDMHRYLGLGTLVAAAGSGFFFPTRTGAFSLGAALAAFALLVNGLVFWLDSDTYKFRAGRYAAIVATCTAAFFGARFVDMRPWELIGPGIGLALVGILLRQDAQLRVDMWLRRACVAFGLLLVMGWAAAQTLQGDVWWLVVLLVEGALTVAISVGLRSSTMLAAGGLALAFASLRAMLLIAQAGYLFIAFAAVAIVLLVLATALALGRERYASGMRAQFSHWD